MIVSLFERYFVNCFTLRCSYYNLISDIGILKVKGGLYGSVTASHGHVSHHGFTAENHHMHREPHSPIICHLR